MEFHGAPMYLAKDDWAGVAPIDGVQALVDVLSLLGNPQLRLLSRSTLPLEVRRPGTGERHYMP